MKHILYIPLWIFSLLLSWSNVAAETIPASIDGRDVVADSIMNKVILCAPLHERIVDDYRAELYIKGQINIPKKNYIIRFLPTMFRLKKGVREYMIETYSDLHFTAPNIYDQKVKASVGTASEFWEADGRLLEYFNINIYSSTLLFDKLLSPLASNARKYYTYTLDSVMGSKHDRRFKIRFMPKSKSFQLVGGYMIVSDNVWSVREIRFAGRSEVFRFNNLLQMGEVGEPDEFLPKHYDIEGTFRFLGNVIEGRYMAVLDYKEISQRDPSQARKSLGKSEYDLSESYTSRTDTNAYKRDTAYFNTLRPIPLTQHEKELYRNFLMSRDTVPKQKKPLNKNLQFWGEIGDALISRYTVNLNQLGSIRCSPVINPFLLSYSASNGLSYRQEFKYNRLFSGDRLLRIVPKLGYNFKLNELYWSLNAEYDYWPEKRASWRVEVGNGNRIYSSDVLDELKAMPDSLFDFNQIHLDYFRDLYFRLTHSWEITNGLTLDLGLSMHRRMEVQRSKFVLLYPDPPAVTRVEGAPQLPVPGFDPSILNKFRHAYNSFAPRMRLTWTPGQYYYMNGKRKINLYSKYPTFSVEWERGISGVLQSSGTYERLELDFQHNVPLGLMRDLYFRLGWGAFTNQDELYFVDFANLRRSNLPTGWNDEIGGVFQLLDGRWYNSSRNYIRGHITYEAPFLLLRHFRKYTQHVLNERIYFNALSVPHLKPYLEVGYGIGTNIFDFGVFASFANWQYKEVGVKFTFELFNR